MAPRDESITWGESEHPLSYAQESLWFAERLEPHSAVYNVNRSLHLRGALNPELLEKALDAVVSRHDILRTTLHEQDGTPVQVVTPKLHAGLTVMDLRQAHLSFEDTEVQRILSREAGRPFDLSRDLMLRAVLLRLRDDEHILLISMHHIACDEWSMGIFFRELGEIYSAHTSRTTPALAPLAVQYADYVRRQRELLPPSNLEELLAYWKRQLGGLPPLVHFPTDYPRPARPDHRGGCEEADLAGPLCDSLERLAARQKATLFMVFLAAFQLLLKRCSGQDEIAVGVPMAGRGKDVDEGLIGFFVNTLLLRADLSGNPTFEELLRQVRDTALEAYDHQNIPFERVLQEAGVKRDLARNALFDFMLNYTCLPAPDLNLPGVTATPLDGPFECLSKFAMTLYIRRVESGCHLKLVYQKALFSAVRMACVLRQFGYLLEQVAARPDEGIDSYSLVTPNCRLLPDPAVRLAEPAQTPVTELFSEQARSVSQLPAIIQGANSWTYARLHSRALALACFLSAHGMRAGDVAAVSGAPSFGLIAAVLGVLFGGGVILPIAPDLPLRRKQVMVTEARARFLLDCESNPREEAGRLAPSDLETFFINPNDAQPRNGKLTTEPVAQVLSKIDADDPAYIFFTSGSSGVPKAVLGCHKGLSHFITWQRDAFGIGRHDRVAQLTALSFDVFLRDVFLPLVSGATLCLPEGREQVSLENVLPWIDQQRVTVLHAVPTLARAWMAHCTSDVGLEALRWVFFSGEPLTDELACRWRAALRGGGRLVNLYGLTETTLAQTHYLLPADTPLGIQPIGWPLPQTQALVLAENQRLCGIGEPGQIVLRTPFRTLGYVNAPDENAKRFVRNPFRDDPQDLVCLTGDRGRYRLDGSLDVLGRVDEQVKIHGVRIEPAEINAVLARHDSVRSCYVGARENEQGELRLVAYVVASRPEHADTTRLTSYLSEHLPPVMIPNDFVFLDHLPMASNGKIDRKALPAPARTVRSDEARAREPRTPMEEKLASIWSEVLALERVGVRDNFFELGGNSLSALQLVSRVRTRMGIALPLRRIFDKPTIADLARVLEDEEQVRDQISVILAQVEELSDSEAASRLADETN